TMKNREIGCLVGHQTGRWASQKNIQFFIGRLSANDRHTKNFDFVYCIKVYGTLCRDFGTQIPLRKDRTHTLYLDTIKSGQFYGQLARIHENRPLCILSNLLQIF
ncbi:MAG: hypothetical protein SFU27_08940, partial [Thermonemataceae bacterium]|nr:hypothetical protein [Thermonemataceae bacterium]